MNQPDQTPGGAQRPPKPYSKPTLTTFGELARLTKALTGPGQDFNGKRR